MKYEITCVDDAVFLLDPIQFDPDYISGLEEDDVITIDRAAVTSIVRIHDDGTRETCELSEL